MTPMMYGQTMRLLASTSCGRGSDLRPVSNDYVRLIVQVVINGCHLVVLRAADNCGVANLLRG